MIPQKKTADIHELFRVKSGCVFGDLMSVLTIMKGIRLAYNKDIKKEKERIFDAINTVNMILSLLPSMIQETIANKEAMYKATSTGFINATDWTDYLTEKGLPFRDTYQVTGNIIQCCEETNQTLETLSLAEYKEEHVIFE